MLQSLLTTFTRTQNIPVAFVKVKPLLQVCYRSKDGLRFVWAILGIIFRKRFLENLLQRSSDLVGSCSEIQGILVGSSWQVLELKILLFKFLYAYFHLECSSHFSKMLAFCVIEALLIVSLRK